MNTYPLGLPCALALDRQQAVFRLRPEDFRVKEELGFTLTGKGEHLWLHVEKTGLNTMDVVRHLARITGIQEKDIGFAGLKDKHAVASQWFSLPGAEELELAPDTESTRGIRLLEQQRNQRKLRRGSHRGNHFAITLRDVAASDEDISIWQDRIANQGCPNYFGPQRFGHDGGNLDKVADLFAGKLKAARHQRGLYLSAARSFLFNQVLGARVAEQTWNTVLAGDVMALQGTGSVFAAETGDEQLATRLEEGDIHITGPLWGAGENRTTEAVRVLETNTAARYRELAEGLEKAGLSQERRPLRVIPGKLSITSAGNGQLVVEFSLPRGTYATSVLREMVIAEGL